MTVNFRAFHVTGLNAEGDVEVRHVVCGVTHVFGDPRGDATWLEDLITWSASHICPRQIVASATPPEELTRIREAAERVLRSKTFSTRFEIQQRFEPDGEWFTFTRSVTWKPEDALRELARVREELAEGWLARSGTGALRAVRVTEEVLTEYEN